MRPLEEKIADLVKTVEFISAKYDELLTNQKNIEAVNVGLLKENELLKSHVINLQNHVEQLGVDVNDLEQYGRRECLEIQGIPVQQDEVLDDLVCSIGNLINVNIKAEDISISHRLKSRRTSSDLPPAIIVKFVRRTIRDKLYYAKKYLKDKSTSDLGLGRFSDKKIYHAESLTRKNKDLFNKDLKMAK